MKSKPTILLSALALAASSILATAQTPAAPAAPAAPPADGGNNNNGGNRQRGQGGQGGNFADFMARMNDRLKTSLKVTDEEWTVLKPLVEKVQTAQRDAGAGRGFGGRGGGPGGNNNGGDQPADTRPGAAESAALRTAVESDSTSADDLKAKLTAVREVRKKGAASLAVAREELKKVVTVRQEAVLVSMGILE